MKIKRLLAIGLVMGAHLFSCQVQKAVTDTTQNKELIFGSGGGFTGQVVQYTLLANGQLFKENSQTKERKEVKTIDSKQSRQFIAEAERLNMGALNFNHPGNIYYFIELAQGAERQRITWGDLNNKPPVEVESLYQSLQATVFKP